MRILLHQFLFSVILFKPSIILKENAFFFMQIENFIREQEQKLEDLTLVLEN